MCVHVSVWVRAAVLTKIITAGASKVAGLVFPEFLIIALVPGLF